MSGVKAITAIFRKEQNLVRGVWNTPLVCSVKQENEGDDGVRGTLGPVLCEYRRADRLQREEDEHANTGGEGTGSDGPNARIGRKR